MSIIGWDFTPAPASCQLSWLGKDAVVKHHQDVPFHLLHPVPALSIGDSASGNLIVQGAIHHAAFSKKSTCTASYGNSIFPSAVLSSTPQASRACTSPCTALTSRPARRAASRMVTGPT